MIASELERDGSTGVPFEATTNGAQSRATLEAVRPAVAARTTGPSAAG
jgi:hypothetical protein